MGDNRPVNQQVGLLVGVGEPVTDGETHYESYEPDNNHVNRVAQIGNERPDAGSIFACLLTKPLLGSYHSNNKT